MKQEQPPFFRNPIAVARRLFVLHGLALLSCWAFSAFGATFPLPADGSNIVGQLQVVTADSRNTLLDIARHYDLGYEEITAANPGVSIWLPGEGTRIVVPTEFILPPRPWEGIIVNIPQRRLYYFPRPVANEPATVVTFPIGVARPGWPTPLGSTRIIGKYKDPSWFVPKSIQEDHRRQGEYDFPEYFPPGPDNPMGMLAMQTGLPQIFIHSTNRPWGVGMRVSHGCIRLYPENAADLFSDTPVGTPVRFVNEPVLAGERNHLLYLSVFRPFDEYPKDTDNLLVRAIDAVALHREQHDAGQAEASPIDWDRVQRAVDDQAFIPTPVGIGAPTLAETLATIEPEPYDFEPYGIEANDAMPPEESR